MAEKVRFGSDEWLAAVGAILPRLAREQGSPEDRFSLCEVFTDAPRELAPNGRIAWYFVIEGQDVEVGTGEYEADARLVADYAAILPNARLVYTPEYLEARGDAPPDGAEMAGDTSRMPSYITELHNELAAITA